MLEVAPVAVGYAVKPRAMDDDARRIAAALVGVAHFGPEDAAARGRLARDRSFERAREPGSRQLDHGRAVGALDRIEQRFDAGPGQRRYVMHGREIDEIQRALE